MSATPENSRIPMPSGCDVTLPRFMKVHRSFATDQVPDVDARMAGLLHRLTWIPRTINELPDFVDFYESL